VLAGDHLKAASDLGVPLVGVGLLYQEGYFHQYLSEAGWQQEMYPEQDFHTLPLTLEQRAARRCWWTCRIPAAACSRVCGERRSARAAVPARHEHRGEPPEDRDITDQLYGGDLEMRIRQEIVLGIGGVRALAALGFEPPSAT
jgi:glycogen phosphorylase